MAEKSDLYTVLDDQQCAKLIVYSVQGWNIVLCYLCTCIYSRWTAHFAEQDCAYFAELGLYLYIV